MPYRSTGQEQNVPNKHSTAQHSTAAQQQYAPANDGDQRQAPSSALINWWPPLPFCRRPASGSRLVSNPAHQPEPLLYLLLQNLSATRGPRETSEWVRERGEERGKEREGGRGKRERGEWEGKRGQEEGGREGREG